MNDPRQQPHGLPKTSSTPHIPKMAEPDLEPIALDDDEPTAAPITTHAASPAQSGAPAQASGSKIRAFSVAGSHQHNYQFKRNTIANGTGAIRVRTFHGRLSDEGLAYMDDKINEWLDGHPEIEVKNVTTAIGIYDGKIKENALILNVWY